MLNYYFRQSNSTSREKSLLEKNSLKRKFKPIFPFIKCHQRRSHYSYLKLQENGRPGFQTSPYTDNTAYIHQDPSLSHLPQSPIQLYNSTQHTILTFVHTFCNKLIHFISLNTFYSEKLIKKLQLEVKFKEWETTPEENYFVRKP